MGAAGPPSSPPTHPRPTTPGGSDFALRRYVRPCRAPPTADGSVVRGPVVQGREKKIRFLFLTDVVLLFFENRFAKLASQTIFIFDRLSLGFDFTRMRTTKCYYCSIRFENNYVRDKTIVIRTREEKIRRERRRSSPESAGRESANPLRG